MTETRAGEAGADVLDILTADHQDTIELIGRIESAPDAGEGRDLADTVIAEGMCHSVAGERWHFRRGVEQFGSSLGS